jgi:hypothetical protein
MTLSDPPVRRYCHRRVGHTLTAGPPTSGAPLSSAPPNRGLPNPPPRRSTHSTSTHHRKSLATPLPTALPHACRLAVPIALSSHVFLGHATLSRAEPACHCCLPSPKLVAAVQHPASPTRTKGIRTVPLAQIARPSKPPARLAHSEPPSPSMLVC